MSITLVPWPAGLIDRDAPHSDSDIGAAAVTALSDDLLPGWYDHWAVIAAEDWRQLHLHALEAVAARLTAAERLAEAAAAALTAVRAEPLRENARGALIRGKWRREISRALSRNTSVTECSYAPASALSRPLHFDICSAICSARSRVRHGTLPTGSE